MTLERTAAKLRKIAREGYLRYQTREAILEAAQEIEAVMRQPSLDVFAGTPPHSDNGRSRASAHEREGRSDFVPGVQETYQFVESCAGRGAACFEVERALGKLHQTASSDLWTLVKKGLLVKVEDWLKERGYDETVQQRYRRWCPETRMWVGVWVATSYWQTPA